MIRLSDRTQNRLDEYLRQVRASLEDCEKVDAKEVQQDITEHIERELAGTAEPVSLDQLDDVLRRLGGPQQWVPGAEATERDEVTMKASVGREYRLLAYVAFGLFLLCFLIPIALQQFLRPIRFYPLFPWGVWTAAILLLSSFFTARVVLYAAGSPSQLAGQRWLVYPPLIVVYVVVCVVMLLWPVLPSAGPGVYGNWTLAERTAWFCARLDSRPYEIWHLPGPYRFDPAVNLALWWLILAVVLLIWPGLLRIIFRPFANRFNRRWAGVLLVIAILLIVVFVGPWLLSTGHHIHSPFLRRF